MIESWQTEKKKYEFDDDNIHHMKYCCYCLGMNFALGCNHLHCLQMVDETMVVGRIHQSWSHRPMMEVQWAWLERSAAVPIVVAAVVMSVE